MTAAPLTRPRRLVAGDRVAVVAPSGPVPKDRLDAGCERLRSWGLDVVVGRHVTGRHDEFDYLSGADPDRAADLVNAWCDPSVSAVLCARGGYGVQRMMELLDWSAMRDAGPKILAGYSDITALHEAFANLLGLATLHAPMVATQAFIGDAATAEMLRRTLFEPDAVRSITSGTAETLVPGTANGVTVGGCLSLLAGEIGTPTGRADVAGGILIIEDVGEKAYRLDGFVTHLLRSGWLDGVAGIAFGSFTDCEPVRDLMLERLGGLGVPIVWELGFGHGQSTLTVPLGVAATLDADAATLTLALPALT
ncbi:MAG TPA: LD-carboxypeptidase [Jiangellaceae bacterium]|nr:LD-carboxypeptidase [Jiangellaceae bacterium]